MTKRLNFIFETFKNDIEDIFLLQPLIKRSTKEEIKTLNKIEEYDRIHPRQDPDTKSYYNTWFRSIVYEKEKVLGQRILTTSERVDLAIMHKNKQYLWLLVEAYERFSQYLKRVYLYGEPFVDNLWLSKDYPSTFVENSNDPKDRQLSIHLDKKPGVTIHILKRFRKAFPEIQKYDENNILNINLWLAFVLIERIRHQVVHCGGIIKDNKGFLEGVVSKAGLSNNGNIKEDHRKLIDLFMDSDNTRGQILLLDIPLKNVGGLVVEANIFRVFLSILPSYAELLFIALRDYERSTKRG